MHHSAFGTQHDWDLSRGETIPFFSHNLMVKPGIFLLNPRGRGDMTRAGVTWKHREAGPGQDRRRAD